MQTKTYFASSVPAALDVARKELGPDAMLLNSKPAPAESRAFGRLEVTFAYEARRVEAPKEETPLFRQDPVPTRPLPRASEPFAALEALRPQRVMRRESSDLEDLRRQVEALRVAVGGTSGVATTPGVSVPAWGSFAPVPAREGENPAIARLQRNGLSEALARDIVESAGRRGTGLADEIAGRIPSAPFDAPNSGDTRTLAFVGPSGRGKTTSLVKIAVQYGISRRVPVRIYQAGAHGIGCQEQMARYAAILGVPFLAIESMESLHLSLSGDGWKGLVLIDTPGISPAATGDLQELSRFFMRRPEIERHLVLRADARSADMAYMVSRFSAMGSLRLLFTGAEEALTTGAMVETLISAGLGATFTGTGPDIPDDLEEFDSAKLARAVCSDRAGAAVAAG